MNVCVLSGSAAVLRLPDAAIPLQRGEEQSALQKVMMSHSCHTCVTISISFLRYLGKARYPAQPTLETHAFRKHHTTFAFCIQQFTF